MGPLVRLKAGVTIRGLRTEMAMGHSIVAQVFIAHGFDCVVTSATEDAGHGFASLHWSGCALDYRTRHIQDGPLLGQIVEIIRESIGMDFDVLLESDHLHVEYQPKCPG